MKKLLRRFVPPILRDLIEYINAVRMHPLRHHRLLNKNADLNGKYDGQSVFILGNGPSLNNFDLHSIKGCNVITMNHFELHPLKTNFQIVAHCIGEPFNSATWEDPTPMLEGVKAESYWFNVDAAHFLSDKKFDNIRYYLPGVSHNSSILEGNDLTGVALQYQSTSQMAINIAIFLGFKDIYLLGFDHDWLVTRGKSPHFYEEPDGMAKADFSRFTYIEMIKISLRLFEIYIKLKSIARSKGARIWNLSAPSYLDVFPTLDGKNPQPQKINK